MSAANSRTSSQYQALYRSIVEDAAAGGSFLMGKLVAAARTNLQAREASCRDLRERDALAQSAKQLRSWESELCNRYPLALQQAFAHPEVVKKAGTLSNAEVDFDALELMDEVQVMTSVTLARTQQVAILAAEASLAELNTLICGTLGLNAVHPERNPLRPQIYVSALHAVVEQTRLPAAIQLDWLTAMSAALGQELRNMYVQLCTLLREQGVVAAGYAVMQTPTGPGVGRGIAQNLQKVRSGAQANAALAASVAVQSAGAQPVTSPYPTPGASGLAHVSGSDDTLLTLDKLRRLLSGELEVEQDLSHKDLFARRFAREFEADGSSDEAPVTDFDATVPAALEALKEMEQVDEVVHRLKQRRAAAPLPVMDGDKSVEGVRASLRSHARGVAQALSLEVVTLMVDNIASDARLLGPVQQLIRRLEPPLLRLALVDPRLFTDKQHPARVLVQDITHHSLAYPSERSVGFTEFVQGVEWAIAPLNHAVIDDSGPFEMVLKRLQDEWGRAAQTSERNRKDAMQALEHAEQRNLLAEKIGKELLAHPDAAQVPAAVIDFLCGPWAQVVAQAQLAGQKSAAAADKYHALISAMLWSTHPELTRQNTAKLTRLVPLLLGTLREGLDTIRYPSTRTSAFLETLMGLHQQAFRGVPKPKEPRIETVPAVVWVERPSLVEDGNPWVAPEEARASNFMDLPDFPPDPVPPLDAGNGGQPHGIAADTLTASDTVEELNMSSLPLGSWVELMVNEQWTRTQLTWASPHGTLFLFTNVAGATQSMTRRSRDKLVAAGQLRVISGQPLVDGALNAVAQMAMRNSVNTML